MATSTEHTETIRQFQEDRYLVVPDAVNADLCEFGCRQFLLLRDAGQLSDGDQQVARSWCAYGQPFSETLMDMMTTSLSERLGCELAPTYSYTRVYEPDAAMNIHQDREACEFTATLTLGCSTERPWELYLRDLRGKTRALSLRQGDLVIFKGHELPHWRDPWTAPEGSWQVQVFMHYVDANGPFKHTRFDERPALCVPKEQRTDMYAE